MLTGDIKSIANKVGEAVGIQEIRYEMLPQDKYNEVEKMKEENKENGKTVAFVGDGINDSPVLVLADVGISMGGIGAASSIEASDVVIMTDDISKINVGIKIAKKTNHIISQNLIFAISVKVIILILSALGISRNVASNFC